MVEQSKIPLSYVLKKCNCKSKEKIKGNLKILSDIRKGI